MLRRLGGPGARERSDTLSAHDYALVQSDKKLQKTIENEDLQFSDSLIKINLAGKRQQRVIVVTGAAVYNFKRNAYAAPQKRVPLQDLEAMFVSKEDTGSIVITIRNAASTPFRFETMKRNALVNVLIEARKALNKNDPLEQVLVPKAFLDKVFVMGTKGGGGALSPTAGGGGNPATAAAAAAGGGAGSHSTASSGLGSALAEAKRHNAALTGQDLSTVDDSNAQGPATTNNFAGKKVPPAQPKRKEKGTPPPLPSPAATSQPASKGITRRISAVVFGAGGGNTLKKYQPRCPPAKKDLGVVQPIWSLIERALEPLVEEDKPAPGLVRCADVLVKLVGDTGPENEEDAMQAIAALCFDHDAARALLKSLADNVPILGGSALVDSLDALQRCEDPTVRKWAVKALWKLLPMCMSENSLPTTSQKWMTALGAAGSESHNANADRRDINPGERAFLETYFHGAINASVHEKEPLLRIKKRRGSFNLLGAGYRNSAAFPGGITPLLVQQAFAHVLLQNFFEVQRRSSDALRAHMAVAASAQTQEQLKALKGAHAGGYDDTGVVQGIVESDCLAVMELLLNSLVPPHEPERRVDVIGKRIRNAVMLPTLMGMLVLIQDDSVRQNMLKEVSLLLLRSETNLKTVLDIPDWPLMFVPLLQTVPRHEVDRTAEQRILHKYVLNLLTMIHTYCFKEPQCTGGPLSTMLGTTFHALAVFGEWNQDAVAVARIIIFGLIAQLSMTARLWWHDENAPEWSALGQLVRVVEQFIFFLPEKIPAEAEATVAAAMAAKGGGATAVVGDGATPLSKMTKHMVAQRAIEKAGAAAAGGAKASFSEDDSDSDDDLGGGGGGEDLHAGRGGRPSSNPNAPPPPGAPKKRKRKFSITPIYELKGFEPVLRPLGPSEDRHAHRDAQLWITKTMMSISGGDVTTPGGGGGGTVVGGGGGDVKKSGMAAASEERIGLHVNSDPTHSTDLRLVETLVELLKRMGVTGIAPEDARRREALKNASKKFLGLLKTASEWCQSLMLISELLTDLSKAGENSDAYTSTMRRIVQLVNSRYSTSKSTKMSLAQTKAVATKLEASVLKQRQVAKQQLEAHARATPVKVAKMVVVEEAPPPPPAASPRMSNLTSPGGVHHHQHHAPHNASQRSMVSSTNSSAAAAAGPPPPPLALAQSQANNPAAAASGRKLAGGGALPNTHSAINVRGVDRRAESRQSIVARTRFYSSVTEDNDTDEDESVVAPPPLPALDEDMAADPTADGPPCNRCGLPCNDDFDAVHKFDRTYHADCFTCDECSLPLLKSENPDENNVFFKDSLLKKFCSPECRMTALERHGPRGMCPGCMCVFAKGDKAVEACNRLWHVGHLRCNDCRAVLGLSGGKKDEYFPVQMEGNHVWPYCGDCHAKRFRTCAKCVQPIAEKDDAVDALGHVYHRGHFCCVRCGDPFQGNDFYVEGHGDTARALCEKCWNDAFSPRIVCDACGLVLGDKDDAVELGGKIYHASNGGKYKCFKCSSCTKPLVEGNVFETEKGNLPLCDECFYKNKGLSCQACGKLVVGEVLHAEGKTWHPLCFSCEDCNGIFLGGRYVMVERDGGLSRPMCESHWVAKFAKTCNKCGLALDKEKVTIGTDTFHPTCLVCNFCHEPLVSLDGTKVQEVHRGPDEHWYCAKHQDGVCAFEGCGKTVWGPNDPLKKIAHYYYCREHFDQMSESFLEEPCCRCGDPIREGEGLQALDKWYHIPQVRRCFVCFVCDEPFANGEDFKVLRTGLIHDPAHERCLKLV